MSNDYARLVELGDQPKMRDWCSRPGRRDKDGKPLYYTQQSHKQECDVNYIIKKYDKTGLITHIQKIEARFGDVTGADFRQALDLVINSQQMFDNLPADIKKRFQNSPGQLLEFMEDSKNREEAIKLGLIRGDSDPESDGFGEHVKEQKKAKKADPKEE